MRRRDATLVALPVHRRGGHRLFFALITAQFTAVGLAFAATSLA